MVEESKGRRKKPATLGFSRKKKMGSNFSEEPGEYSMKSQRKRNLWEKHEN